jgi:hypothetical protein
LHFLYCFVYITISSTLKWSNYYLAKTQNTEPFACAVSFHCPGDSEDSDGGGGNEEDDENSITNSLSLYSAAVNLTIIKEPAID